MLIGFTLEVEDWRIAIICETETLDLGLCGELAMVLILHHLVTMIPNFLYPFPDGAQVLRSTIQNVRILKGPYSMTRQAFSKPDNAPRWARTTNLSVNSRTR